MDGLMDVLAEISEKLGRIAVALETLSADAAHCAHGVTGLCMSCVIQGDLLRPHR